MDRDAEKSQLPTVKVLPIVVALGEFAGKHGMTIHDLADRLDVPYSTATAFMRGDRPVPVDVELRERMAELLGVSGLQIAIWCGLLSNNDFVVRSDEGDRVLDLALERVRADASVGVSAVSDAIWAETPRETKVMVAHLYQQLSGQRLLPTAKLPA